MDRIKGPIKSRVLMLFLSVLAGVISTTTAIYPSPAVAQEPVDVQDFVLTDGITVTNINPLDDPLLDPVHANDGAFEGGLTGTKADARSDLAIPEAVQRGGGGFNIPTGAPASPDFGVQPFTQKMLRFEEFGPERMKAIEDIVPGGPFPAAGDAQSSPDGVALDTFLKQDIYPYPTEIANTTDLNPWQADIEAFLGRPLLDPPAEGRPPGAWWSHQRWDEFVPQNYFQSAQAGARDNGGLRDDKQRHGYALGEFGPGGLYHNTVGAPPCALNQHPCFDGQTFDPDAGVNGQGIQVRFHPGMPIQDPNSIFTFDGTLPPKLLNVRYGEGLLFRHYNALPIDPSANNGFGLHTISTHEHNGHNPAESDGYTNSFFFPGQFNDYRWPIQLAGLDSINMTASDARASFPCSVGETLSVLGLTRNCVDGRIQIPGDYRETMSTHWFHDHMLDFTAQNVYKGNAAMMNYYSAIDRGNEAINDGVNLRFPSGTALDWGNRDYDVNLLIAAKAWDQTGQMFFNVFNTDGFLGDRMLVNWLYKPTMDVRKRRYRLRLLNGAVSRYLKVAMVTETGAPVPFHLIANDGNILEHAVRFPNGILPTQAIAERYDIIVDFSAYPVGTKLYMVNLLEHKNGRGPEKDAVPLAEVLSGAYDPVIVNGQWEGGDPVIGKFMEFVVQPYSGTDQSLNPLLYEVGGLTMLPQPSFTQAELDGAVHRSFHFGRSAGADETPWTVKTDGGMGFSMDPRRLSAAPDLNGGKDGSDVEIWHLTTGGGWSHPIHVHFEEGKVLSRDGMTPPIWETLGRKDVYRIGPEVDSSREITVAMRFREFQGTYMEHCHNTQHEDTAMLMRWDIESPTQIALLPTPMPTWDGVGYADAHALATFRSGDLAAAGDIVVPTLPANGGDVNGDGIIDRIFDDVQLRFRAPAAMELAQVPDMQHILDEYIADPAMAVALGKSFFWDSAAGSNGEACASCHFEAGADSRSKSQLSPGLLNQTAGMDPTLFDITNSGGGGVNYPLTVGDFPFSKLANGLPFDDVTGSQGTYTAELKDPALWTSREQFIADRTGKDVCNALPSDFSLAGLSHRQVTGRNSPSVINAVFNHRNFWDGRANNMFNGHDPFGRRSNLNDPTQGVWINDGGLAKTQVLIKNSSLASQAVGPLLSTVEMACAGRVFPLFGEKMLGQHALRMQRVSSTDSVLGGLVNPDPRARGLTIKYEDMIEAAFKPKYWNAVGPVEDGFTHMEANFSLYWGLAIQLYEATLVSNQTRFDDFARGDNTALTENEKLGLEVFVREDRGACVFCHNGSAFTSASVINRALAPDGGEFDPVVGAVIPPEPFERMRMADGIASVYDGGFYNIGVTQTEMDKCIGADVMGSPLSFSRQAAQAAASGVPPVDLEALEDATVNFGDFAVVGGPVASNERVGVDGACKTPSIRNVELTAPYFHNGSHSTLPQVITSYMLKFKHLFADENLVNLAPQIPVIDIQGLATDGVSIRGGEVNALVDFMKTVTDERVRLHQAPFDHPELIIPNGSTGLDRNRDGLADDARKVIPAVGAAGYAAPLPGFLE